MYSSYSFSISALDGGEWSASRPGRALPPAKGPPGIHFTGGWVGLRAGLDTEARGKILLPLPGIEPRSSGRPSRNQTLYWLSYPAHHLIIIVSTYFSYPEGSGLKCRRLGILAEFFFFLSFSRQIRRLYLNIRLRPLPSTAVSTRCLLIVPPFDITQSDLLAASLNKLNK
jgi:hypothetical protein